jgi:tetratricopeptide (TPR) repeat protein
MSAATPSFRAFLSYSHVDKAAAKRLHRKLENYRLPGHLRQDGAGGRIGTIFRDSEDLPAATDLSASVRQALAASQALIVLCSPDAKASRWVAREIALFRELHPDRPILAALLRGEPDEAFPTPLHDHGEPLAADLRKDGDGYRLGFLKVVAGVVGVPLDALVQRDSQRQMRRVMAVTGLAAAVALVMAVMTVIALQARSEAQRQQAEAEGLIEYMLTDLNEDLDGAAGVAVMAKVNRRALAYYEGQGSLESLAPDSLERRARAIGRLGENAMFRQDFALARQNFEERSRTTRRLLDEDPGNPKRRFDHAMSLNRLALVAQDEGKPEESEARLRESWTLLSALQAWDSSNREWQRAVTLVAGNLCAIDALRRQISAESLAKCELAVSLGRKLSQMGGEASLDPYNLTFNLMWYGDALAQSHLPRQASQVREEALQLSARLSAENPENRKIAAQRMELLAYLAQYYGQYDRRFMLGDAIKIAKKLTKLDPENLVWRENLKIYQKKWESNNEQG